MFIKIYFGDKPLFLCDAMDETILPFVHHDDGIFIDELNSHTVKTMIHEMQLPKVHAGVFYHPDLEALKKAFYKKFTIVLAGGGVVQHDKKGILLIFRRGKWDLPKGKLDRRESLEECALREVKEETGLEKLVLGPRICITYHTYHEAARFILKESHWYRMKVSGEQTMTPQADEDIEAIKWVQPAELEKYYKTTFPSVVEVLKMVAG